MPANQVAPEKQYKGEAIDDELANGPMTKRTCRDPLCCLLFVAFIGGMIGIAIYGYTKGNTEMVARGYDYDGNMCGIDSGYESYTYLYFPIPFSGFLDKTVCLKTCPDGSTSSNEYMPTTYHKSGTTQTKATASAMTIDYGTNSLANKFYVYQTEGYVSRFCLPFDSATLSDAYKTMFSGSFVSLSVDTFDQWIGDVKTTWAVIAISLAVAFVIGFIYMFFLRYCSGVLTWLAILCWTGGLAVLGWRFYDNASELTDEDDKTTNKVIAYICWGVAGFTLLAVLCLFNRIRLAIAILKAAADYVKATPTVFLVPPVTILILVCFYAFWVGGGIFLATSGTPTRVAGSAFGTFSYDTTMKRLLIYHLFGLLWINAFILASAQFVLASSTALWYFSQGTGQSTPGTIKTSVKRLFRYHFGSIAFGSLILAIVQFIRIVLAYIEAQTKKMQGKENKLVKFALKCLQCYAACFERFIKFLNKNAYIQIALSGKSFCGAAKDAFSLIINNPLRLGVVSSIGSIFVLFGKIFVAGITALIAFLVITKWDNYSTSISSPFIPTLLVFIFAYVIGAVFMTIYGLAADTILACFIVDEQLNKKKNAPPRHCPDSLRNFLDNHAKKN